MFGELRKWIYVVILKDIQVIENKELIKTCFIRAKFMELLSTETGKNKAEIGITPEKFMRLYTKSLMWVRKLSY